MTMTHFFLSFLQRNIVVTVVILTILMVRLFIRKCPKKYSYMLWSVLGIRMMFDLHVSSAFSLFNLFKLFHMDNNMRENLPVINQMVRPAINAVARNQTVTVNENQQPVVTNIPLADVGNVGFMQLLPTILMFVWGVGMAVLLVHGFIRYIRLKRKVRFAVKKHENVYECDDIDSPFVLGIIRSRIYIPFHLDECRLDYILEHEKYHVKRYDPVTRLAAFILLIIYWMNPLVWVAFSCFIRDQEMSCDEAVLLKYGNNIKQMYSQSLLQFATEHKRYTFSPLSFGESGASKRIKNILSYKKPKRWIVVIGVLAILGVICSCLTNSKEAEKKEEPASQVNHFHTRYSEEEIKELGILYYEMKNQHYYIENLSTELTYPEDNRIQIRLYESNGHTLAMYDVDADTLIGEDSVLFEEVDLTDAIFYRDYQKEHNNSITCIYDVGDYYIFAAGEVQGTIGYFSGAMYKYDKKTKTQVVSATLTDAPQFWLIDNYIYYDYYFNSPDNQEASYSLNRVDLNFENEEVLSELTHFVSYDSYSHVVFGEKDLSTTDYRSDLIAINPKTLQSKIVFEGKNLV